MHSFYSGTLAGAGTFNCDSCGFPVALRERDEIPACPHCGEGRFVRASMFAPVGERIEAPEPESPDWLQEARGALSADGDYVAYDDGERIRVMPLSDGFTRLGRSLSADVRFDDPTVSRRHAIFHRDDDCVKVIDDRSLNGVFVNGERRDWHELDDGDEVIVGRFRLYFISLAGSRDRGSEGIGAAAR